MSGLKFTKMGYMELETIELLINEALTIRRKVVASGGMSTKSSVEDYLMAEHPELDRYDAHHVMNTIETRNLS